ncbi:MAG TPA: hypothetical protein VL284_13590 [Thermoanaerobaculia bacterium]|nr:hypothetical protein [Thermoanaerobaculia bacterium]
MSAITCPANATKTNKTEVTALDNFTESSLNDGVTIVAVRRVIGYTPCPNASDEHDHDDDDDGLTALSMILFSNDQMTGPSNRPFFISENEKFQISNKK